MMNPQQRAPAEGQTVRITNTKTGEELVEGPAQNVRVFDSDREDQAEDDDAVYMEVKRGPDKIMLKKGVYEGEPYSWVRIDDGDEYNIGNDCWEFETQ